MATAICSLPAAALDITTEDNAPFNYPDGQRIGGISTDILNEMSSRAGVPLKIQLFTWSRAYQTALTTPDTCVYSAVRLPEREALFKWVGPLTTNKWALFARSDFKKPLARLEDAKNYRIGSVADAKTLYLKSQGFGNIDIVSDDNLNLAKLISGRIDLWMSGFYKGKESLAQTGIRNVKPVLVVREVDYYLACNPKTPEATLAALSSALDNMRKDGFVKKVADSYADRTK